MAGKQHDRRCQICAKLLSLKRCKTYPRAILCGGRVCHREHQRRLHNAGSMRYDRRERLAKKELAKRALQTNGHGPSDTPGYRAWDKRVQELSRPLTAIEHANRAAALETST